MVNTMTLLIGILSLLIVQTKSADAVRLVPPFEDTFIASDLPDHNMGRCDTVYLGTYEKERRARMLIKFDPREAGIKGNMAIQKVILRLNWSIFLWWDKDNVIRVHRVLRPWQEGRGTYGMAQKGETTWKSAMHGQSLWDGPGCSGPKDRTEKYVERNAAAYNMDFDVTEFYREWERSGAENTLSFLVIADDAGQESSDPRKEYIAVVVSRNQTEPAGANLLIIEKEQTDTRHQPLWKHSSLNAKGGRLPAQFGLVQDGIFYGSSYNGHVYKIDLESGKLLCDWFVTPSGCYSAPLMVDGKLYLLARDKKFYRLEQNLNARALVLADYSKEPGTTRVESLAYDPKVKLFFLGTGSNVHAVDEHGEEHWCVPHKNLQWGEPMACDGALYTYDTSTRKVVKYFVTDLEHPRAAWECDIGFVNVELSKGPDGDGDMLIFISGWKHAQAGTLTAIHDSGPSAGKPKWGPIKLAHPLKHCSLWEGHNLLLLPAQNGYVECREASTGRFARRIPIVAAGQASSPWSQVTISGPYALVTTHDVLVRENFLYVFDIASGAELWRSAPFDGAVGCMIPVLSNGIGVVGTYETGTWYAFRLGKGKPVTFSRFANARHTGCIPGGLVELQR